MRLGMYREEFPLSQDYDLWLRVIESFAIANIDEVLGLYRYRPDAISASKRDLQILCHRTAHRYAVQRRLYGRDELGYEPSGASFQSLRLDLSRGGWRRGLALSDRYLFCACNCAFISGQRDRIRTLMYLLAALGLNPSNLRAWVWVLYQVWRGTTKFWMDIVGRGLHGLVIQLRQREELPNGK